MRGPRTAAVPAPTVPAAGHHDGNDGVAVALGRLHLALTAVTPLVTGPEQRIAHAALLTRAARHARRDGRAPLARALDAERAWIEAAHRFTAAGADFTTAVRAVPTRTPGADDVLAQMDAVVALAHRTDGEAGP